MTDRLEHHCPDPDAQAAFGAVLAAVCPVGCIVHLHGDLGAGKTTLVRGFLRGRGHDGPVRSPTYTLIEPYELADGAVYHLDLYRLGDPEELEYLGLRDLLGGEVTLLIEWPERGEGWLPSPDLVIDIAHLEAGRDITVSGLSAAGREVCASLLRSLSC
jgi:tRNA threonylcarbamoyladenosine biosynthesis protein TsaE